MKDSIKTRQRFFLVGCSRSGTSVLQSRLANHSQVFSLPETEFLRALFGRDLWYWFGLLGIIRGRSARRAHEKLTQALESSHELPPSTGRFGCAHEQMRRFISLLDELADQEQKLHWLEKSPKHFRYLSHIDKYVPDARVIHIVRDGRAVAASLRNRALQFPDEFGRQMDPRYGVRLWNQSVRTALGRLRRGRDYLVVYEQFSSNPEDQLRQLTAWMDIAYEPGMLEANEAKRVVRADEQWKEGITQQITPAASKFEEVFSSSERHLIERSLDWRSYERLLEQKENNARSRAL